MPQFLFAIMMLITASQAFAGWVEISAKDGGKFYIDPATIRRAGPLLNVTELQDYKEVQHVGPFVFQSMQVTYEVNCQKALLRPISYTWFTQAMGQGHSDTFASPDEWRTPNYGGYGEYLIQISCGKEGSNHENKTPHPADRGRSTPHSRVS